MILQICMENIDCNCSHGIRLHLTNIFWNCILGLNGLVLKFIIFLVQSGQARSWGPLGKWTCHPQSSPQPRTRQRAGLRPNAAAWLPKDQFVPECRPDALRCSSLPMKQASSSSTSPNQFPAAVKIDSISTSLEKIYSVLVAPQGWRRSFTNSDEKYKN